MVNLSCNSLQEWVGEHCLKEPERLCTNKDLILDPVLSNKQAQKLLLLICYPHGIKECTEGDNPQWQHIKHILQVRQGEVEKHLWHVLSVPGGAAERGFLAALFKVLRNSVSWKVCKCTDVFLWSWYFGISLTIKNISDCRDLLIRWGFCTWCVKVWNLFIFFRPVKCWL